MKIPTSRELRRHAPLLITGLVVTLAWGLQFWAHVKKSSLFNRLENIAYDERVKLASQPAATAVPDLAVVAIDDLSLQSVNISLKESWPWPRHLYGRLVEELVAEGAKVIAVDILFFERQNKYADELDENGNPIPTDEFFARKMREAGNVVLAASSSSFQGVWQLDRPTELLRTNAASIGHIVVEKDPDGVLRRARAYYDDPHYGRTWHLAIVAAARYLDLDLNRARVEHDRVVLPGRHGQQRIIPTDREGNFYIDWALRFDDPSLTKRSFSDFFDRWVRRGRGLEVPSDDILNRIVFVGSLGTGNNIVDQGATPLAALDFLFSKHWNIANSIILNRFITRSDYATEMLLVLLVGLLSSVVTWRLKALWASALILGVLASYLGLSILLFAQARYWLPVALPTTAGLLTHLSLVTYRGVVEQRERHRVRSIFSKVVSPDVVNELLNLDTLRLGGSRRITSVYFADIRGFTTVTDESHARAEAYVREHGLTGAAAEEYLDAQAREILATVNLYLGMIADCVKQHGGTFDKYIGDCAMAFWGAPTADELHAVHCVRAAIDAQQAIYRLNSERAAENQRRQTENQHRAETGQPPVPLLTLLTLGSGVNTGVVTVGLMGSDQHGLNYTVFGREVNLASRLEGISGRGRIIIGVSTYRELERRDSTLAAVCLALPPVAVKGFREPVAIYEVEWRRLPGGPEHYDTGLISGIAGTPGTDFSQHPWAQPSSAPGK